MRSAVCPGRAAGSPHVALLVPVDREAELQAQRVAMRLLRRAAGSRVRPIFGGLTVRR